MDHSFLSFSINELSLFDGTKCNDCYAISVNLDEVVILVGQNAWNLWFPQLEALMSKDQTLRSIILRIQACNVKSIDEDGFITNDYFFYSFLLVSQDKHISITNIHFILLLDKERIVINLRLVLMDLEHEKS